MTRAQGQRGAVAVIYAILTFVLFVVAATVIDLGALRGDVRSEQSIADLSATAGAIDLDPVFGGTPYRGCRTAWQYFLANAGLSSSTDPCSSWPTTTWCDTTSPLTATGTAGPYTFEVAYPIDDPSPYMEGRVDALIDGSPCERVAVRVRRTRSPSFGGVAGAGGSQTHATAVARASARNGSGDRVPLVLLDQTGCKALVASGQAQVLVFAGPDGPGIITVDSAGTETSPPPGQGDRNCSNALDYAVDTTGNQNSKIKACGNLLDPADTSRCDTGGIIYVYALMPGQGNGHGYDPNDVISSRLYPQPVPGNRITRAPVDHRYNCTSADACPYDRPAYIDDLRTYVGSSSAPIGFQRFSTAHPNYCQTQSSDPAIVVPEGDWWIDCGSLIVNTSITFTGGRFIFDGTIDLRGGSLCINVGTGTCASPQPSGDAWVYVRGTSSQPGRILKGGQAALTMEQTFVYLNHGDVSFGAGAGALTWVAPVAGDFEDLAMWSEAARLHEMGGQAGLELEGIFFAPGALPFRFTGQADYLQTNAQFITYRIELSGQGVIAMAPDPARTLLVPLQGVALIR